MDEVEIDQVEFDADIIKPTLSPDLWENGQLNPDVRKKLLRAAKAYYDYLDIEPVKLKDITITGSIANYNYHDLSDIDVHLILDYADVDDNVDLVGEFFATKKALWGEKHDIQIKGHDLEFYAQDAGEEHHSTGVFSLVKNDWNIEPTRQDSLQVDAEQVRKKAADFMNRIEHVADMAPSESQIQAVDAMKEKIKTLRQAGLNSAAQEFSVENLVFKVLRNTGYLQKLSDAKLHAVDSELSLDEKAKSQAQQRFFAMVRGVQSGKIPKSKVSKKIKDVAGDISTKDASDFAKTKHKGLPKKKNEHGLAGLDPNIANAATNRTNIKWGETPVVAAESKESNEKNTLMVQDGIEGMTPEKVDIIKDFISFTRDKLGLEEPVKVGLRKGRDEYIQTTASYLPYQNENYVRCEGRALVDILRSIGHELTHNRQREMGIFDPGDNVQNIGGHIEDQANSIAGILIKDFVDNHGYAHIHDMY
ncbi:MAG: hypothetical protein P8J32_03370 [bacterium]|nr:hypothetical protein [bacterium]